MGVCCDQGNIGTIEPFLKTTKHPFRGSHVEENSANRVLGITGRISNFDSLVKS